MVERIRRRGRAFTTDNLIFLFSTSELGQRKPSTATAVDSSVGRSVLSPGGLDDACGRCGRPHRNLCSLCRGGPHRRRLQLVRPDLDPVLGKLDSPELTLTAARNTSTLPVPQQTERG